jgi:hypothetical protein
MKQLSKAIIFVTVTLTACTSANKALDLDASPSEVGAGAVLPPKYLSVEQFESCLATKEILSSYQAWCMPAVKPERCPVGSWAQLSSFQGNDKLADCTVSLPPHDSQGAY